MDPLDGLAQQGRDREDVKLLARRLGTQGNRVGHHEFLDLRFLEPADGRARQDRVGGAGVDMLRPLAAQGVGGLRERAGRVHHVVEQDRRLPLDLPDDVHHLGHVGRQPALVDDGEGGGKALGEGPRPLDAPGVRGDDHDVVLVPVLLLDVLEQHRRRVKVVHRDVEEPLDLSRVKVHRQQPGDARRGQEVGHELRRDRGPREDLPVLPRVSVIREHRRHPLRRGALEAVHQDQQLHQVVVHRGTRGLDHENIHAADVVPDLDVHLAVAEPLDDRGPQRDAEVRADLLRKIRVRVPGENLQSRHATPLYPEDTPPKGLNGIPKGGDWQVLFDRTPGSSPRHGWEGRGRTFIWGFKGPGPAVRRPPSAPAILAGGRDPVKDGAGSPLVRPDHGLLDHLSGLVVQGVRRVPVRAVLRLLARHGDEQAGAPLDDLEVADDEAVVEDDRGVPFQLLVVRHRKDLHLGDPHPGLLPFP